VEDLTRKPLDTTGRPEVDRGGRNHHRNPAAGDRNEVLGVESGRPMFNCRHQQSEGGEADLWVSLAQLGVIGGGGTTARQP
jgi:hypothetical protein